MVYFQKYDHIQGGLRPAIIVQNNVGNSYSPNILAVPLTGAEHKKRVMPTHVLIQSKDSGLYKDSIALCEQQQLRSKNHIGEYITTLPYYYNPLIGAACTKSTPMLACMDDASILKLVKEIRNNYNIIPVSMNQMHMSMA